MTTGVVLLNFGEPATADPEPVREYLTRIFYNNARLESADTDAERWERAAELAARRLNGLLEEYETIGGSPLNAQAARQASALEATLVSRGFDVETFVGMQFTGPYIEDAVSAARDADVDRLVALPVYPLCGESTTIAALDDVRDAVGNWDVPRHELTGWHRHPGYNRLRAENIERYLDDHDIALDDDTAFVFSAHGTPQHYLDEGSRYELYVEEYCAAIAGLLGIDDYELGYQNHANRSIPWTEPEIETVIEDLDVDRVVVEPVSFMHEQSETLSELDVGLNADAAAAGIESFHRVPIPHDDPAFPEMLADLVEPFVAGFDAEYYGLRDCQCQGGGAYCLNAPI